MKLKAAFIFFVTLFCSLKAMEAPESSDKKEEETTSINLSKLSLAQQIMHIIAQNIATHIVKDKALILLKAPSIPLLQNLPQEPKTAIDEAFTRLRKMYTQEIIESIALTASFHLLFSKESASNKQLYLELILPYLSEKQKDFFTLVKDSILSIQNVLSPNTPLKQGIFKVNNFPNPLGITLLHFAAYFSNPEALAYLIVLKGLVNQTCTAGETPLHYAVVSRLPETIKLLLEHDADSTIKSSAGFDTLTLAFSSGQIECVKTLIEDPKLFGDDDFRNKMLSACLIWNKSPEAAELIRSRLKETRYYKELPKIVKLHLAIAAHTENFFKYYDLTFKDLIEKNENQNVPLEFITLSPVNTAAVFGNTKAIQWLTAQGEDINKPSSLGNQSSLHFAIINRQTDTALLLIELGADIEMPGPKQNTPLLLAIQTDNHRLITTLLDKKANIHAQDADGNTPLHIATVKRDKDLVKLLIQKGANLAVIDNYGQNILQQAIIQKDTDLVSLFLDLGISVNSLGMNQITPLMEAAYAGSESIVRLLIDKEANINARDLLNRTALFYGILSKNPACIKALIEAGISFDSGDLNVLLSLAQITDFSIDTFPSYVKEIISLFLSSTPQDKQIQILHEALRSQLPSVVKFLLTIAPKLINLKNTEGSTLLHTSILNNCSLETIDAVLTYGASLEIPDNDGNSPLHLALTTNNDNLIKLLITKGAPLDTPNAKGLTPLAIAIMMKSESLVRLLVEHGASVNTPIGHYSFTAITLAEKECLTEIVKILTERK